MWIEIAKIGIPVCVSVLMTVIGGWWALSRNQTRIETRLEGKLEGILGELHRIHEVLEIKLTHTNKTTDHLEHRIAALERFKEEVYRLGILNRRDGHNSEKQV